MHHISTIYARFICRELALSNEAADELLQDSVLSFHDIHQKPLMPYLDFFSFLQRMQAAYKNDDLGLRVGSKLTPPSLGELGNAMLCAPNMAAALKLSADFAHVHAAYYRLELNTLANGLQINFIELADLADTQQFQTEVMMLMAQNLIEALTGTPYNNGYLYFPYQAPSHRAQYREYFHSSFDFDADHAGIFIPGEILASPSPFYDPELWQNYQIKLSGQLKRLQDNSAQEVTAIPYTEYVQQFFTNSTLPLPDVEQAAASLHMTSRTLSRYLKKENTSFRQLRNQKLKEQAELYLSESDLTIDAIACQLGYKDFSSFRRAFKLWFSCSPSEFRKGNINH